MICPKCNVMNAEGVRFCGNCGRALSVAPPQQPPMQGTSQGMYQQQPYQQSQMPLYGNGSGGKKSGKGLIIGLVAGAAILVVVVAVLVVMLLRGGGTSGEGNTGDGKRYKVSFDGQTEGRFVAGEEVKVTYPLATDTDYWFTSDDVDFQEDYEGHEAVLTFTMPAHNVTIHVEARNTMLPPEPNGLTVYDDLLGTWYPEGDYSGESLTVERDGSFAWKRFYPDDDEGVVITGYLKFEDGEADWGTPGLIDGPRFEMYDDDGDFLNLALALEEEGVHAGKLAMLDGGGAILFTEDKPNAETMGEQMSVRYAEDFENEYGRDEYVYTYEWDETIGTIVVFLPGGPLKDVSFLKLDDFTYEDGISRFSVREEYSLERMDERQALYVELVFPGDTPHFGIAYTDETGTRHYYALEVSGMDGSLSLGAFEPR